MSRKCNEPFTRPYDLIYASLLSSHPEKIDINRSNTREPHDADSPKRVIWLGNIGSIVLNEDPKPENEDSIKDWLFAQKERFDTVTGHINRMGYDPAFCHNDIDRFTSGTKGFQAFYKIPFGTKSIIEEVDGKKRLIEKVSVVDHIYLRFTPFTWHTRSTDYWRESH